MTFRKHTHVESFGTALKKIILIITDLFDYYCNCCKQNYYLETEVWHRWGCGLLEDIQECQECSQEWHSQEFGSQELLLRIQETAPDDLEEEICWRCC